MIARILTRPILTTMRIAVLPAILIGWGAPIRQGPTGEFPQEDAWTRVTPSVVWCGDPSDRVTIEVHIVGRSDVAGVQVTNRSSDDLVQLFDDGTHGDAAAGDRVFTRSEVYLACFERVLKYGGTVGWWLGFLRFTLQNGQILEDHYGVLAGVVNSAYRETFAVQGFGSGLSATRYAFFVEDAQHEVIDDYPVAKVLCGTENFEAYRKLYSVLPDAFDFALVTPGERLLRPQDLAENVPYQVQVSNSVQHIGLPMMDRSAQFGSAGRLTSVIYESFGDIQIFDHEVAHTWGAAIGSAQGLLERAGGQHVHWNPLSDIGGQLGAYYFSGDVVGHFADNGDGTWRVIRNSENEPYVPLELYLMGLIPAEEVPPIHILQAPDVTAPASVTAARTRTVTIDDLLAAEGGPRVPESTQAQRDFRLAYIVVQDRPFSQAAYAYFSLLSYALMSRQPPEEADNYAPFYWATGGRATLDTSLPVDLPEPSGLPGQPAPTETPPPAPTETSAPEVAPSPPATAEASAPATSPGLPCTSAPALLIAAGWSLRRRRSSKSLR